MGRYHGESTIWYWIAIVLTIVAMVALFWKAAAIDRKSRSYNYDYSLGVGYMSADIERIQRQIEDLEARIEELKGLKKDLMENKKNAERP